MGGKKKRITIVDIANEADVSIATVSRAINGLDSVTEKTRNKVLNIVRKYNFKPNAIAKSLASKKYMSIGIVVKDISRTFVAQMTAGILIAASEYKYTVKIFSASPGKKIKDISAEILSEGVNGIIFLYDEILENEEKEIEKHFFDKIPMVLTNMSFRNKNIPSVTIDYKKSAYDMVHLLYNKGRRNILMLSTRTYYFKGELKERGYIEAIEELGLSPNIIRTTADIELNQIEFKEIIQSNIKIDAVVCVRDSIAVSFLNVAIESGKNVPNDIMIVSLQGSRTALLSRPKLTNINIPIKLVGQEAMIILTKLMNNEEIENKELILTYSIDERETT